MSEENQQDLRHTTKQNYISWKSEGRERERNRERQKVAESAESLFKEITAENSPNLG